MTTRSKRTLGSYASALAACADVSIRTTGNVTRLVAAIAIKRARENIERNGMDALTQRLFSDMFVESSDPKLRDRLVARAQKVDRKFREELFVDLIRWDVTKSKDALKQIKSRRWSCSRPSLTPNSNACPCRWT